MNPQPQSPYESAKQERKAYIIDWIGEHLVPEKKISCSGWPRTSLLLVISHSAITEDEASAEKMALNTYNDNEALERTKFWQETIRQREAARWLPVTTYQVA